MNSRMVFLGILLSALGCTSDGEPSSNVMDFGIGDLGTTSDTDSPVSPDVGVEDVSADDGSEVGTNPDPGGTISQRYPADQNIASDPAVLFHDDFESGWGRWDAPQMDTRYLNMVSDSSIAHSGEGYLRSSVTRQDLEETQYISSASRVGFERQEEIYWRFYARMPEVAPNPHHWVRVSAGNQNWERSGLANTVPPGDEGFWFDFDINNNDVFNFYVYWHEMRSGRCNDGSTTPGCAGDQGTTYHYGNVFQPPQQDPYPRDEWFCIEMRAKANTPGQHDGELSFWIDDNLVGDYRQGHPQGTWLRATFHTDGCEFSACTDPEPFEGFNFRTSSDVGFKSVILDAYYERGSSTSKRETLEGRGLAVSDNQVILYDDVVVATERIGCRVP